MGRAALRRTFLLLLAGSGLAACVPPPGGPGYGYGQPALPLLPGTGPGPAPGTEAPGHRVALLVPLKGRGSDVGQALQRAAQLALDQPNSPPLDVRDTGGTPDGAAAAARAAISGGAGIILGPLTAGETSAVAPIARAAGVPVLAFTSDSAVTQPGVWALGITPGQQVRRLVAAVQAENRTRLAAVVPANPFGDALAAGLTTAATEAGLPPPRVARTGTGGAGLLTALQEVSDYAARHGNAPADPAAPPTPAPPAPIDALLIGATGPQLAQTAGQLPSLDLGPAQVRILGPALWAREAPQLGALAGAWYAAPDPTNRAPFERAYAAKYGTPPRDLASLAFDAAGVARASLDRIGYSAAVLTQPQGFAGADGPLSLLPDGRVRRSLAVFELDRNGSHLVLPAATSMAAPGS